jgi:hypothetical protein
MILSTGPAAWTGPAPLVLARWRCWRMPRLALPSVARAAAWSAPALSLGWGLHLFLLLLDIGGWGQDAPGARLGFAPVLSMTVWLVIAVHGIESRLRAAADRAALAGWAGAAVVALAWLFPGEAAHARVALGTAALRARRRLLRAFRCCRPARAAARRRRAPPASAARQPPPPWACRCCSLSD